MFLHVFCHGFDFSRTADWSGTPFKARLSPAAAHWVSRLHRRTHFFNSLGGGGGGAENHWETMQKNIKTRMEPLSQKSSWRSRNTFFILGKTCTSNANVQLPPPSFVITLLLHCFRTFSRKIEKHPGSGPRAVKIHQNGSQGCQNGAQGSTN